MTLGPDEDNVVGRVDLGRSTTIIFSVKPWKGRPLAHVRKFVSTAKYEGPTKAGLVMAGDVLLEVIDALRRLHAAAPGAHSQEFTRVAKRDDVEIVISTVEPDDIKALPSVDVREFVDSPAYAGPTKRGIRFPWEKLPEVLHLLESQAQRLGAEVKQEKTLFPEAHPPWTEKAERLDQPGRTSHDAVLAGILPDGPKDFPDAFVEAKVKCHPVLQLPAEPVRVTQKPDGKYAVTSDFGFSVPVRNAAEGNYIVYAQLRGKKAVRLPKEMFAVFSAVKAYENYVRELQRALVLAYERKTGHKPMAEHQARQAFKRFGLPWLQ